MPITTASLKELGPDHRISAHFTLGEFASKDGADLVKYSTKLLFWLEELRRFGDFTIEINSGYRTASYNRAIGGASKSQHVAGNAADITVKRNGQVVDAALICCLCQYLDFPGIAYISPRSVHVDMRENGTYRGDERKGYRNNVPNGDFYSFFGVKKSQVEALKVKKEEPKESEEEEMIYKDITEVPEWGREAVQLRLDHGWSDCKDIEHSLLRSWVTLDKENPYIADMEDVKKHAEWAIPEVQRLFDMGKLKGTGAEPIAMRLNELRVCIINNR